MHDVNVERIGLEGPHLVMLHGWGQSLKNLQPLGELLSDNAQVHLIDLPGFGLSKAPPEAWSSFQYADHIIHYLDQHKIEQCCLLGHSFGGKVAMSLAVRYPDRVKRLILMGSSGLKRRRAGKERMRFKLINYFGKAVKMLDKVTKTDFFRKWFSPKFGSADYLQADPKMRAILVKSVNEDMSKYLAEIKAPTLLLWGRDDQETPLEVAERLKKSIKNSQLVVFDEKGHYIHQDCGSHLCASYIIPFLS